MMKEARSLILFLLIACACGCNQGTAPEYPEYNEYFQPTPMPDSASEGEYGCTVNGQAFDSKTLFIQGYTVSVSPYTGQKAGAVIVSVWLFYDFNNGSYGSVDFSIPLINPESQTIAVSNTSGPQGTFATASIYSSDLGFFQSLPGGTITITKLDKFNNLISGTFNLAGSQTPTKDDPSTIATVTSGYFNGIQIGEGSFEQGTITAAINGVQFSENNSGFEEITASASNTTLNIEATGTGLSQRHYLYIDDIPLVLGTTIMNDTSEAFLEYHDGTKSGTRGYASTQDFGSNGVVTITMCDTIARRVSGLFVFSGRDSSGHIVDIASGEINNVQYVRE